MRTGKPVRIYTVGGVADRIVLTGVNEAVSKDFHCFPRPIIV